MIKQLKTCWNDLNDSKRHIQKSVECLMNTLWIETETSVIYKLVNVYHSNSFFGDCKVHLVDLTSDPIPWFKRRFFNEKRPNKYVLIDEFIKMAESGQVKRLVADNQK